MAEPRGEYSAYVGELGLLVSDINRGAWRRVEGDVQHALNGQAAERLRKLVPLDSRRSLGAFFTTGEVRQSFSGLLETGEAQLPAGRYWDPTCGAGDLLLAASANLPVGRSLVETLRLWAPCLRGGDLQPEFVESARLRLILAAAQRTRENGGSTEASPPAVDRAFRSLRVEDGLTALRSTRSFRGQMLLNPPYGSTSITEPCDWASGSVSQAAVFALTAARALAVGHGITAVLPDVLRSGSRYERWRTLMSECLDRLELRQHAEFDAHTDIHVFLISAVRQPRVTGSSGAENQWWTKQPVGEQLGDRFEVRVGSVVDNRDPHEGPMAPFLTARGLPASGQMGLPTRVRQFAGRLVEPPFVAIRRTSRPGQGAGGEPRGGGVLVTGEAAVAVDNHIITARPLVGGEEACRELLKVLAAPAATAWLDERIRCRHLTVRAVREIPWTAL